MHSYKYNYSSLKESQVYGPNKLNILKIMGTKCILTDFAILLGGCPYEEDYMELKDRTCFWTIESKFKNGYVPCVNGLGKYQTIESFLRQSCLRPAVYFSDTNFISNFIKEESKGLLEIEFGVYPQYVFDIEEEHEIKEALAEGNVEETGKVYITDSRVWNDFKKEFEPREHKEYEYRGKKFIIAKYNEEDPCKLSNGKVYRKGDEVVVKVSPIKWLVDEEEKLILSKNALVAGIRNCESKDIYGYKSTEANMFLNEHFAKDINPGYIYKKDKEQNIKVKSKLHE